MFNRDPFYSTPHMSLVYSNPKGINLWLGDYSAATDTKILHKFTIKAVLTVAAELQVDYPEDLDIKHKKISALDAPSYKIRPHFAESREFILQNMAKGNNVLVHCSAGISRSAAIVIAFLMQKLDLSYLRAHAYLKKKRHLIEPNYGFKGELSNYEKKLSNLQTLKDQLRKPQNNIKGLNQISNYLTNQKKFETQKFMRIFQRRGSEVKSNLSTPKASINQKSKKKQQKIRIRVKSETRGSLPKIYQ